MISQNSHKDTRERDVVRFTIFQIKSKSNQKLGILGLGLVSFVLLSLISGIIIYVYVFACVCLYNFRLVN